MPMNLGAWRTRAILAGLLFFGSEVILWTEVGRSPLEWALLLPGYLALAALLLELAQIYRARSLFEAMTLTGMVGLANGVLLNPFTALAEVPRTLVTRAMGGHALVSLAMLGLFLLVMRPPEGGRRARTLRLLVGWIAALVGLLWGAWARWSPLELGTAATETPLPLLLALAAGALALIGLMLWTLRPIQPPPDDTRTVWLPGDPLPRPHGETLRLTRLDWTLCAGALVALALIRIIEGVTDGFAGVAVPLLLAYCVAVLYFRQRKKRGSFVDEAGEYRPSVGLLALAAAVFLVAGVVGYELPRGAGSSDPLALLAVVFTGYGLVWLPCVSLVLGWRAFNRRAGGLRL
jgi:hypothetical protein